MLASDGKVGSICHTCHVNANLKTNGDDGVTADDLLPAVANKGSASARAGND